MSTVMQKKISLIQLRIRAGFRDQTDLAKAASITKQTVLTAEKGRPISKKTAYLILEELRKALKARNEYADYDIGDIDWNVSEE